MKNEIYYWVALIAIVIAAALAFRYYYSPSINIGLGFSKGIPSSVYQYQKVTLPLFVYNNGSEIKGFDIGILINGNLSGVYNVSLAGGKETEIDISHSFGASGNYNFTAVADPAKLYNVNDRAKATASFMVDVRNPVAPAPASLLPSNAVALYAANMTPIGYAVAAYLAENYSLGQMSLSDMPVVTGFLKSLLDLTGSYVANVSYAGADYNNSRAYSLWFSGYLRPTVVGVLAQAMNLTYSNATFGSTNLTIVDLNRNTTLCGWYGSGWVQTFAYQGNATCLTILQSRMLKGTFLNASLAGDVPQPNDTAEVGNFSYYHPTSQRFGRLSLSGGDAFLYSVVWKNFSQSTVCYGIVNNVNGTSYCSAYVVPRSGLTQNASLIRTTAYKGGYNETVFALVNTSRILVQVGQNIALLGKFGISGSSASFTSGIHNSCSLQNGFSCSNATYGNSNVTFVLKNVMNTTARINALGCFWNGGGPVNDLNKTVAAGASVNITGACYNNATLVSGVPLDLNLHLLLNYTENGKPQTVRGDAFII